MYPIYLRWYGNGQNRNGEAVDALREAHSGIRYVLPLCGDRATMKIGIVGHAAEKFTPEGEAEARRIIREILADPSSVCVSGACHMGGVDVWAVEEAKALGREFIEFPPKTRRWSGGYRERNLQIADTSDEVHVIVVDWPKQGYTGMVFDFCYHCHTKEHVKSGGCWTAKQAEMQGKDGVWHIVKQERW